MAAAVRTGTPCIVFEDEHLLVVNKPPGWNTHSPSPYAGEGIYEWLRRRERAWSSLAIVHRLDKETSGLLVFTKTALANGSLTRQFEKRQVRKRYQLLAGGAGRGEEMVARAAVVRRGARYEGVPQGPVAETRFFRGVQTEEGWSWDAEPLTGRTHQIRVHAAMLGIPVVGDSLYGGAPFARLCLHAAQLEFLHPETEKPMGFSVSIDFSLPAGLELRQAVVAREETTAFRLLHGGADGEGGVFLDIFRDVAVVESKRDRKELDWARIEQLCQRVGASRRLWKQLSKQVRSLDARTASPVALGERIDPPVREVLENGVKYQVRFEEGYSVGLFLDQRENRRRLLTGYVGPGFELERAGGTVEVLNVFAYTCAFSVCAALSGAVVTSLDLSRKYLDWGRENFALNSLDPGRHDFIYGDAFQWMRRLEKKGRRFGMVLLDPPTFSQSKESGVFRAEEDYGRLVELGSKLLVEGGVLFASSNAARMAPETFLEQIRQGVAAAGKRISQELYVPQPPDFPVSREDPAYLKTVWMRVGA